MRVNTRPLVRGAWYYEVGDLVTYVFEGQSLTCRVTYAYPVRQDGERQSLTLECKMPNGAEWFVSASNVDVDPMGAQND